MLLRQVLPILPMNDQMNRAHTHAILIGQILLRLAIRPTLPNLDNCARGKACICSTFPSRIAAQPLDGGVPTNGTHATRKVWPYRRATNLAGEELHRPFVTRGLGPVQAPVLAAAHHLQVFGTIVVALTVDVVDKLNGGKSAPQHLRSDNAVFPHIPPDSIGMVGAQQLHIPAPHNAWLGRVLSGFVCRCSGTLRPRFVCTSNLRAAVATAPMQAIVMAALIEDRIETITGEIVKTFLATSGRLGLHVGPPSGVPCLGRLPPRRGFIMPNYSIGRA